MRPDTTSESHEFLCVCVCVGGGLRLCQQMDCKASNEGLHLESVRKLSRAGRSFLHAIILIHVHMIDKFRSEIWRFTSIGIIPSSNLD
jgi:hypothetical protein